MLLIFQFHRLPVVSPYEDKDNEGSPDLSYSLQKRIITREHRQECFSTVERIFGDNLSLEGDFIVINFFALEGWSLAELFHVRCIVAAPYVVPYSAPSSFERHFRKELPLLFEHLQEAPVDKVSWKDVIHWMWPLFTEDWGSWRSGDLNLSPWPFTDPVTGLPMYHDRSPSPLLLYGFSEDIVECPGYWPSNVRVCGFWFLPMEWQFSCIKCAEMSALICSRHLNTQKEMCSAHADLESFLKTPTSHPPIFIGPSSVGSMGFLRNPQAFLRVLQSVLEITSYRFILFSAGYEPLNKAVRAIVVETSSSLDSKCFSQDGFSLFSGRLFYFSGMVPYDWLFPRCSAAIHHGGSGSTAAALRAGIPQVLCPFMLDQFYWAERMFWLGVSPEPLKRNHLLPDKNDDSCVSEAASVLSRAINCALSLEVKARASEIAERISHEDGVIEAVKILKEELRCF
ncbi:hypothetical protein L1049_015337 [Liquidambar formosana]|uniref:Erythromycin biosynthesis protein CIII-like C-terminal domain-containing protein n=1 Tax=Liquidambar formosana TaxID=63359 RepID=A0AAP0WZP2_LIQFO